MPASPSAKPSWVCPTPQDRERFEDLHRRLIPLNLAVIGVVGVLALPVVLVDVDPAMIIATVAGLVGFGTLQRNATRFARPELWVFWALLCATATIALIATRIPDQQDAILMVIAWPVAGLAGRFRTPVVAAGVALTAAIVVATQVLTVDDLADTPLRVTLPIAAIVAIAVVIVALRQSDVEHRAAATVDPLTGALNRRSLEQRVAELEQQSRTNPEPVAVALIDLDLFKVINDIHGHAAGDAVLKAVAGALDAELRSFDLTYRLGGEEFVVLMPGADLETAARRAEHLRAAVADVSLDPIPVTASIGVSATTRGEPFVWTERYEEADARVYEAKRAGRDRVVPAPVTRPAATTV